MTADEARFQALEASTAKLVLKINVMMNVVEKCVNIIEELDKENASLHKRVTMLEDDLTRRVQNQ